MSFLTLATDTPSCIIAPLQGTGNVFLFLSTILFSVTTLNPGLPWMRDFGATENAGQDNDGRSKLQGRTMDDGVAEFTTLECVAYNRRRSLLALVYPPSLWRGSLVVSVLDQRP